MNVYSRRRRRRHNITPLFRYSLIAERELLDDGDNFTRYLGQ